MFTEWTNVGKAKPLFPGHYQLVYLLISDIMVLDCLKLLNNKSYWPRGWCFCLCFGIIVGGREKVVNMPAERMLKSAT
jgi:hypothetical protein